MAGKPKINAVHVYQRYIGALTILGEYTGRMSRDLGPDDRFRLRRVFEDANQILEELNSTMRYKQTAGGSWGAFDD